MKSPQQNQNHPLEDDLLREGQNPTATRGVTVLSSQFLPYVEHDPVHKLVPSSLRLRSSVTADRVARFLCNLLELWREILLESRTAILRIRFRHTNRRALQVVDFGAHLEESPNGHLVPCRETHARLRDRAKVTAKFPWARTQLDALVFLETWEMGAKWGENQRHMGRKDTQR